MQNKMFFNKTLADISTRDNNWL